VAGGGGRTKDFYAEYEINRSFFGNFSVLLNSINEENFAQTTSLINVVFSKPIRFVNNAFLNSKDISQLYSYSYQSDFSQSLDVN
jgi:hypothetical protein